MIIAVAKEILAGERRVSALPESVKKYIAMGYEVIVESGAGDGVFCADRDYAEAGASIIADPAELFARSDLMLKVKQPEFNEKVGKHEAEMLRAGSMLVTFLHPAAPVNHKMVCTLRDRKITAFTMDGIPRISRAQRMDALTSMSMVAGYKSLILAANLLPRFIPLLGTAMIVNPPAKILVVGVGVVGLQAIATARSLGATVSAIDVREDARQAAGTLGAAIPGFDVPAAIALGKNGAAKQLPREWLEKERQLLAPLLKEMDIVILCALVPGEVAPVLLTDAMVAQMKPGSVIVDVAIDQGGNCALTRLGETNLIRGVTVCGVANIPGSIPVLATQLYAANLMHYITNLMPTPNAVNWDDPIVQQTLVTREGRIVHAGALQAMQATGKD